MNPAEYDPDFIKLYWQVVALRGQLDELERERNQLGNVLWMMRLVIIKALLWLEAETEAADLHALNDGELLLAFERAVRSDWRFSPCPNAERLHCRPVAMQTTRDGDLVHCSDCGWDIREGPLPRRKKAQPNDPHKADQDENAASAAEG